MTFVPPKKPTLQLTGKAEPSLVAAIAKLYDNLWKGLAGNNPTFQTVTITGILTTGGGRIAHITRIDDTDSPYTILESDHIVMCDTDDGVITANLPAGVDGTNYIIKNTGTSGNDVTLDPNGTEQLFKGGAGVSEVVADMETLNIYFETTENWA